MAKEILVRIKLRILEMGEDCSRLCSHGNHEGPHKESEADVTAKAEGQSEKPVNARLLASSTEERDHKLQRS